MAKTIDSGFGGVTFVSPAKGGVKTAPGARPTNGTSVQQRDWVVADREYKESLPAPKFS